ncbi:CBO0543 family protein [Halalkalibacter wakoensis]|uniref:CBO0543 family protein n=1 Tax=Halalkalibacter wakoensis TaxID=127891 RepID=UPI00272E4311|nr:CBO0543 family protein [Halalkalibacter wakoensis]
MFKGFLSSILDKLLVRGGYIKYPVKLAKCCDISFVFDYLIFPIICVYYNQVTKTSNLFGILTKTLYFSIPMGIIEHFFEKRTSLISFHKGWNSFISFLAVTITFLISRAFIAIIRKAPNKPVPEN